MSSLHALSVQNPEMRGEETSMKAAYRGGELLGFTPERLTKRHVDHSKYPHSLPFSLGMRSVMATKTLVKWVPSVQPDLVAFFAT